MPQEPLVSIGFIAKRTGNAVSLIRYYANQEIIPSVLLVAAESSLVQSYAGCPLFSLHKIWVTAWMEYANY